MTELAFPATAARMRFPGISPRAYEHPADRGAMATLRAVPGATEVLGTISGLFAERGERLFALASAIRVGPTQYPRIHALRDDCAAVLDLPSPPALFVARSPDANAYTIGIDEPFIVLTSALVEALDTESLRFAIGHEMGHVLSGHAALRTILIRLVSMRRTLSWLPVGSLGLRAVIAALREWFRKAELTCDRAGLLCSQDPAAALRTHLYLAGATDHGQIDIPAFLRQAQEYEDVDDVRDSILKMLSVENMDHPFAVVRAAQLQRWAASDGYRAILAGDYRRRTEDAAAHSLTDDLRAAARSYRTTFATSSDPIAKMANDLGGAVSDGARWVFGGFGRPGRPPRDDPPA